MFDDAKEPVDIFAGTDKPSTRTPLAPGASTVSTTAPHYATAARGPSKLLLGIVGLVVLLGAGGAGAYFLMKGKAPAGQQAVVTPPADNAAPAEQPAPTPAPPVEQPAPAPSPAPVEKPPAVPSPAAPQPETPVVPPEPATQPLDSDGDGLTDAEEQTLGTDPQSADTDNDGLTDREEAKIYKTDPLKPDTDGDGFLDGQEVKGGYNPNGPGKLLILPPPQPPK